MFSWPLVAPCRAVRCYPTGGFACFALCSLCEPDSRLRASMLYELYGCMSVCCICVCHAAAVATELDSRLRASRPTPPLVSLADDSSARQPTPELIAPVVSLASADDAAPAAVVRLASPTQPLGLGLKGFAFRSACLACCLPAAAARAECAAECAKRRAKRRCGLI